MLPDQKIFTQNDVVVDVIILCIEAAARDIITHWLESLPVRTFVTDNGYQAKRFCAIFHVGWLLPIDCCRLGRKIQHGSAEAILRGDKMSRLVQS
jgi:hypothetical protein